MDDKKELKKRVKKGGKDKKTKKEKKPKKKSTKKIKESMPSQFVQTQGKGTAGFSMGQTQPFGGGGLSGVLSALGIQPKFNQLGGTTGFSNLGVPIIRQQQVAPKMEEKYIVKKELPKNEIEELNRYVESGQNLKDIQDEQNLYKRLDRAFKRQSKEEVRDHIYKFFGGNASVDMDYVTQDFLINLPTKKAMLEQVAAYMMDRRGGLFPSMIDNFISFNPNEIEEEEEPLSVGTSNDWSTVNVEVAPSTTQSSVTGGENPSELGSVGFGEPLEELE